MKGNESLARAPREEDHEPQTHEEGGLASIEPVHTPPYTPEEKARLEELLAKTRANDNEAELIGANDNMVLANETETVPEAAHGHEAGHHESTPDSHGHETAQGAGGASSGGDHGEGDGHGGGSNGGGHGDGEAGHHAGGHHSENWFVKWGIQQPLAILGYLGALIWQGLTRWKEMAGKGGGGGGHAKKDDHGGGGGHH